MRKTSQTSIPGPEVIKLFSYSTQLSTKFILLINVKMPTVVGILTFIGMINTTSERFKARNFFICQYFSFDEQFQFHAQLSWAWKKFYSLGVRSDINNTKDTQKKYCIGTVSKNILLEDLKWYFGVPTSPLVQMWIKTYRCLVCMKDP